MQKIFLNLALGGDAWVLWLLVLASIVSVGVMIERWRTFRAATPGSISGLMDGIAERLGAHDVAGAQALARQSDRIEGRVAAAGLDAFAKGPATVEEVLYSRWLRERQLLDRRLIILGTLGNNAPYVGLFGTVLGIIKAFNDLSLSGQGGVTVVMSGISAALIATAFGILVAVPAVIANNYFLTRLKQVQTNTDALSRILLAYLKEQG
jgi:biopolymer transport protein ExbB